MNGTTTLQGWVSQPNNRGTMDIIWACTSTIFICVWIMLHLNLPAKKDSEFVRMLRKLKWFLAFLLAPELVMLYAGGQWASAKRSLEEMRASGYLSWTLVHAFYADSGGFMLDANDSKPFPITAHQLYYLVEKGYIACPSITQEEIWDKSKADQFAKTVAGFQSAWFTIQMLARWRTNLPVTLLELSTVCLITCSATTMFFWWYKPLDVSMPTPLYSTTTIASILVQVGTAAEKPFRNTPLDFIEPLDYASPQFALNHLWGELERPLPRIPNDRDMLLHNWKIVAALSISTAAFDLLQLIAWNFKFPSFDELMIWRWTCIASICVLGTYGIVEAGGIVASGYRDSSLATLSMYKLRWPTNLLFLIPGGLYFCARFVIVVETMISLRALPAGCFVNVQWTDAILHV